MKILHTVKSYSPLSGGMYEVVKQISEKLKNKGHEVVIASSSKPKDYDDKIKIEIFNFSENREVKRYQDYLINSDFDIITNFAATQPMTDNALPVLNKIKAKKVFVPTGFNALYSKTHQKYFENMKRWLKEYDLNVFLSNDYQDINFARENNVPEKKIVVIPNGASEKEFLSKETLNIRKKIQIKNEDFLILHVGSFTGVKGHYEAVKIFESADISNAVLLFIGNGETECYKKIIKKSNYLNNSFNFKNKNKKILIPNMNRAETVSAYKEANVFLFPSNTECSPIVLFEAMAAGIPFLTTDVGNAKEIISWSNGGILLPTKHDVFFGKNIFEKIKKYTKKFLIKCGFNLWNADIRYSSAIIDKSTKIFEKLCKDKEKIAQLGKNGRDSWLKNFTWEKIAERYENEYKKLLKNER